MSTASKLPLTAREYLELERAADIRHEFYRGEMTAMSGASFVHTVLVSNLARHLGNQLQGGPCRAVSNDLRVLVDPIGFYCYPDIVVVCGQPRFLDGRFDTLTNPLVLIEILSESTADYDRGEKFKRYRSLDSLRTYVLVSQKRMLVEWFDRRPDDEAAVWIYRSAVSGDEPLFLDSLTNPVSIPLSLIYDGVDLPPQPEPPPDPRRP